MDTTGLISRIGGRMRGPAGRARRVKSLPSAEALEPRCLLTSTLTAMGKSLSVNYDKSFNSDVATFTSTIKNENVKKFQVTIAWGDGTTSKGTVVKDGKNKFAVEGKHTYKDPLTQETVLTSITDGSNGSFASASSTMTVIGAAVTVVPGPFSIQEGDDAGTTEVTAITPVVAEFNVISIKGAAAPTNMQATINWGAPDPDGATTSPGKIIPDPVDKGAYDVLGDHNYQRDSDDTISEDVAEGLVPPANIVITVQMTLGKTGTVTFPISVPLKVLDAPLSTDEAPEEPEPIQTASIGQTLDFNLADFVDENSDANQSSTADYTLSVNWGDKQTISMPGNAATPTSKPLELEFVPASESESDDDTSYFELDGYHGYNAAGTYTVTATITDDGGSTVTQTITVNVTSTVSLQMSNPGLVIAGESQPVPPDGRGIVAYFTPAAGCTISDYTITVNWGDGGPVDTNPDIYVPPNSIPGVPGQIYEDHIYDVGGENGTPIAYTITVTVEGPDIDLDHPLVGTTTQYVDEGNY